MNPSPPPPDDSASTESTDALDFRTLPLIDKYNFAARQMAKSLSDAFVLNQLIELAVEPDVARVLVVKMRADYESSVQHVFRDDETQKAAQKDMLHGGLWCGGGLLVTGITVVMGNHFIFAWGAIIFGAIQFFRGLSNSRTSA